MNIGNTNLLLGLIKDGRISSIRQPVDSLLSRDDFTHVIKRFLSGMEESVTDAIISSVNPRLTKHLEDATNELFAITPLILNKSMSMKLDLSCYDTELIGSDRIAVCEAAAMKYNTPSIVFDFGTATTINVVDGYNRFIGGAILPGLMMGINALSKNTALLPGVELALQAPLIGRNTRECILSGAIFGAASMLDGMKHRIEEQLGQKATVIITGGNANYIMPICKAGVIHAPDLLLEGLYILIGGYEWFII